MAIGMPGMRLPPKIKGWLKFNRTAKKAGVRTVSTIFTGIDPYARREQADAARQRAQTMPGLDEGRGRGGRRGRRRGQRPGRGGRTGPNLAPRTPLSPGGLA